MDAEFMREVVSGVGRHRGAMHGKHAEKLRLIEEQGQHPKALFIACCDARFNTQAITDTEPGVLFVHRNLGAIVPPVSTYSRALGFDAVLEYAVAHLKVEHIIVCGHTDCGAVKALLELDKLDPSSKLKEWLMYAEGAANKAHDSTAMSGANRSDRSSRELRDATELALVKASVANLYAYDLVAERVRRGKLSLIGWRYNLREMFIEIYDEESDSFISEDDFSESLS
jgi:carbonic anhydrase